MQYDRPCHVSRRFRSTVLIFALLTAAGLIAPGPSARAQQRDNRGREFILGFMENFDDPGSSEAVVLFLSADVSTTATIEVPGLGVSTVVAVNAGAITAVPLPLSAKVMGSDITTAQGIRVTAADEIVVYGLNQKEFTTDAFLGLPTDILGTEYVVLAYPGLGSSSFNEPSEFLVVGVEDGTTVTITPSVDTGTRTAGVPFTVQLNRLDTYQLQSGALDDLTGTEIHADRPVAVFAGARCANVPPDMSACDHLVEQLPSTSTWGTNFLTVPLATRTGGDVFRILARDDGTEVRIDGVLVATLNRGQMHEADFASDAFHILDTTGPALVMQLAKGQQSDGVLADPFMMMIPPTGQFLDGYTLSTPGATPVAFTNFINVVVPTGDIATCRVDGAPITAPFTPIGGSGFSGAQIPVGIGSHTITCTSPFGAYAYGFASFDSYGYPGGLALAPTGSACVPPVFEPPTPPNGRRFTVLPGTEVAFTVAASDPDAGQMVTLSATGLPAGAGMTPVTPLAGNPVSSDFLWVPSLDDLGRHTLVFRATDTCPGDALQTATTVLVDVVEVLVPRVEWVTPPPLTAQGGEPLPLAWQLENFSGVITENQVHMGRSTVEQSSPEQAPTNGLHAFTLTAPNISAAESPKTFKFAAAARDDGIQVVSPIRSTVVNAGPNAPEVRWLVHGPLSIPSGGQFPVRWRVSNFDGPLLKNACAFGVTRIVGQTPDQPGGNGDYEAIVHVPEVTSPGTLFYAPFAQSATQFANDRVLPIQVTVDPVVPPVDPPGAPPFLTVPATDDDGTYGASWGAADGVVGRYELQEDVDPAFSEPAQPFTGLALTTTITGRRAATYFYRVRACNSAGCSPYTAAPNPVVVAPANLPPTADAGLNQTVECDGAGTGAVMLDGTTSTDPDGVGDIVTYEWTEGATLLGGGPTLGVTLPVGAHTITLRVTDTAGHTSTDTVLVTVADTTPPTITAPVNATAECAGPAGTDVPIGTAVAGDTCSTVSVTNDAPALFPVGTTTVTWTATDTSGNSATATQTVTIADTIPPTLTAPADVTAECIGPLGTPAPLGTATASDSCGLVTVTNDAPANFLLGDTLVTWTATDASGNTTTATQTVSIVDTTPPAIVAPAGVSVETTDPAGTAVAIGLPDISDLCNTFTFANDAPAVFPVGTTVVTWTATDTAGNIGTDTQTVTVNFLCAVGERVSVDSAGAQATGASLDPSTSADGRFVAFQSDATDLVAGDTNGVTDIFVRDRLTGSTERVSVNSAGAQATGRSDDPSLSADGRFVAFRSLASDLVPGDTNGTNDVFVHDRLTGTTERVSVDSAGVQATGHSSAPALSADGRFVAFHSTAADLVPGDTTAFTDIFVHDRLTGLTERVSVASDGTPADRSSFSPAISADGRIVAFETTANNLIVGGAGSVTQIYAHDRVTGLTELISLNLTAGPGDDLSEAPALNADGRFVAFQSYATDLVPGDTNAISVEDGQDIFVYDRATNQMTRVSVASDGTEATGSIFFAQLAPSISADGRFVAFDSEATNLVPNDTNGRSDVFVHDRLTGQTGRVSMSAAAAEGTNNSRRAALSADGRVVAFESLAPNFLPTDTNGVSDIFMADNCLAAGCTLGVFRPAGGETWTSPGQVTIFWMGTTLSGGNVNVDLMQGATVVASIAANIPNVGFVEWAIPPAVGTVSSYTVRVQAVDDATCGTTSGPISFIPAPAAAEMFPTAAGTAWRFLESGVGSFTTVVQAGTVDVNGAATVLFHDDDGSFDTFVTMEPTGLFQHRFFDATLDVPGFGVVSATVTFTPPRQLSNAEAATGDIIITEGTAEIAITGGIPFTVPYRSVVTVEDVNPTVTVPAGTFPTGPFDPVMQFRISTSFDNNFPEMEELWLARTLGRIKTLFDDGSTEELEGSSFLPPPAPPTITVPATSTLVTYDIVWDASTGVVTAYELERATLADFSDAVQVFSGPALNFLADGTVDGTFYYRVRACNGSGCSAYTPGANPVVVTFSGA